MSLNILGERSVERVKYVRFAMSQKLGPTVGSKLNSVLNYGEIIPPWMKLRCLTSPLYPVLGSREEHIIKLVVQPPFAVSYSETHIHTHFLLRFFFFFMYLTTETTKIRGKEWFSVLFLPLHSLFITCPFTFCNEFDLVAFLSKYFLLLYHIS